MANVYISEPVTKGKVVLTTTMGDLDIEIWPKEAPKACRNFLQLCMEGYYDSTIFHRLVAGFMIQGGDPTGTGTGGESAFGEPFADEFHTRLRFNHRGIVACANMGPNTNNSQFFITLDRCEWLDKKNTIFGKITGDTIYNLLKIGELETDAHDRPLYPPKIIKTEVIFCPFDDIVCRDLPKRQKQDTKDQKQRETASKATKNKSLLSFDDHDDDREEHPDDAGVKKHKGIVSSHDVLDDPRLLKDAVALGTSSATAVMAASVAQRNALQEEEEKRQGMHDAVHRRTNAAAAADAQDDDAQGFDAMMRNKVLQKRGAAKQKQHHDTEKQDQQRAIKSKDSPLKHSHSHSDSDSDSDASDSSGSGGASRLQNSRQSSSAQAKPDGASRKSGKLVYKDKSGADAPGTAAPGKLVDPNDYVSPLEVLRQRFKSKNVSVDREQKTLQRLNAFKSSLSRGASGVGDTAAAAQVSSDAAVIAGKRKLAAQGHSDGEDEGDDWKTHSLKFRKDASILAAQNRDDDYDVYDPLKAGTKQLSQHQRRLRGDKKLDKW